MIDDFARFRLTAFCVAGKWLRTKPRFLQRVNTASYAECYAERCISYDRFCLTDRPSDRPSITRWYHAKTTPAEIVLSSLQDSSMTSFVTVNFSANFQREHREQECRI